MHTDLGGDRKKAARLAAQPSAAAQQNAQAQIAPSFQERRRFHTAPRITVAIITSDYLQSCLFFYIV